MKWSLTFVLASLVVSTSWAQSPAAQDSRPAPKAESREARALPKPGKLVPGDKVPSFTATAWDMTGETPKSTEFDSLKISQITVVGIQGVKCPATTAYEDRLRELETTFRKKGVEFVYFYPNRPESDELKRTYHKNQKLAGGLILDAKGTLTQSFGSDKSSDFYVFGKDGKLIYRGGLDDNKRAAKVTVKYLADALDAALAGKDPAVKQSNALG